MIRTLACLLALLSLGLAPASGQTHQHTFDPIGPVIEAWSYSRRVDIGNGKVVVGYQWLENQGFYGSGAAYVYDLETGGLLHTLGPVIAEDYAETGADVAISGDRVLVSAPGLDAVDSRAAVYGAGSGALIQLLEPIASTSNFGRAADISGDVAVLSGRSTTSAGVQTATVFDLSAGTQLTLQSGVANDGFAMDVATDGARVAASATRSGADGAVFVYDAETGALLHTLVNPSPNTPEQGTSWFGLSIDMAGGLLVVGASEAYVAGESRGKVFVFDAVTGALVRELIAEDGAQWNGFGIAVAVSGGRVLVGESHYRPGGPEGLAQGRCHLIDATTGATVSTFAAPTPSIGDGEFGWSVAMAEGQAIVGSANNDGNDFARGRAHSYEVSAPRMRLLAVGINDDGLLLPLRGDASAALVHDAFQDAFDMEDDDTQLLQLSYDSDNPEDGLDNYTTILLALNEWRNRVEPGDTFVFYLATHGAFAPTGSEVEVCAQSSLVTFSCVSTTGNEILTLGADQVNISDDTLHQWMEHDKWSEVNKLFLIDACMSGGFWGTSADGDTGDLATLPRAALLASSPETKFSYSFPITGITYFSYALSSVLTDLGGFVQAGLEDEITFEMIDEALAEEEGAMLDTYAASNGGFLGVIQGGAPFDLSGFYEQEVDATFEPFAAAGPDFSLTPGGGPVFTPRTLRVPKDVPTPQEAVLMARPGDTILVKGAWAGPLVIEGKQGLTLKGKGARLLGGGLEVLDSSGVTVSGFRVLSPVTSGVQVQRSTAVTLRKLRIEDAGAHGIVAEQCEQITVERCTVKGAELDGIRLGTDAGEPEVHESLVDRSKVIGAERGVVVFGDDNRICRTRVTGGAGASFAVPEQGSGNLFTTCRSKGSGAEGLLLAGTANVALRCALAKAGGDAVVLLGGGGHVVEQARATAAGGHGVRVTSSGNQLLSSRSTKAAGYGFLIEENASSNHLEANKAARNGSGPVQDDNGGNSYEGNSFDAP